MIVLPQPMDEPGEGVTPSHPLLSKSNGGPLKVAVVREELVELTNDPLIAIVLNQLLYWTQRVNDFDLLLEEERRVQPDCNVLPSHGWIYKTAEELNGETMLRVTRPTMRKYLRYLVEQGWLDERSNPDDKWNKTTQYRVNLRKLQKDLLALGYALPGYSLRPILKAKEEISESSNNSVTSLKENFSSEVKNLPSNEKIFPLKEKNLTSYTYTEITSEITNREHALRAREITFLMVDLWRRYVNPESLTLTDERKQRLKGLFSRYFQSDLRQWERFCERIKHSPFLMGQGARRWRVSLDWILSEGNVLKVVDGNFDNPETFDQKNEEVAQVHRDKERNKIFASFEDSTWKEWCIDLSRCDHGNVSLSLTVLKDIARAQFEEFDGKLVWIKCGDQKALNHIENLRLELLPVIQKTFPKARNIRTRLAAALKPAVPRSSADAQSPFSNSQTIKKKGNTHAHYNSRLDLPNSMGEPR
ncbi:MAG: hypothetical protein BGO67_09835 [Alphaproteobacteria bacterium 41-28]|nr:MAG: hypothetical protein BGO67_09835 [Alphaproteobacteria bacterium 41-28]